MCPLAMGYPLKSRSQELDHNVKRKHSRRKNIGMCSAHEVAGYSTIHEMMSRGPIVSAASLWNVEVALNVELEALKACALAVWCGRLISRQTRPNNQRSTGVARGRRGKLAAAFNSLKATPMSSHEPRLLHGRLPVGSSLRLLHATIRVTSQRFTGRSVSTIQVGSLET